VTRFRTAALGLTAALLMLGAAPQARADQTTRWWFVPGAQVNWPASSLGLEARQLGPGAILGYKLSPDWAVEARAHYTKFDPASGSGPKAKFFRGEGNLTLFLSQDQRFTPYLTGGMGLLDASGALDGQEFAWNAGFGFLYHLSHVTSLRLDARNVSFRHPVTGSTEWLENEEVFAGLSIGLGGKPITNNDEDGDGVPDRLDECPGTPKGARVDARGCPKDADGDGVYDGIDECPDTPGGCVVDARGCTKDADKDGVCDGVDRCPDTPAGAKVDKWGCPITQKEQELIETGRIRLENVYFDTAKSTIKSQSFAVLDEVASILGKYDDLDIEIGGHTDARGAEAYHQTLSEARANAVLDYLVTKHGLRRARLIAVGYGESQPIATNDTAAGMAKNRRVEFKVLNPEALKR
jgi:OOP family OmpA-OmpF porin